MIKKKGFASNKFTLTLQNHWKTREMGISVSKIYFEELFLYQLSFARHPDPVRAD